MNYRTAGCVPSSEAFARIGAERASSYAIVGPSSVRAARPFLPASRRASVLVLTECRSRQIQDLTADALEFNRTIVRHGIFRDSGHRVDDSVAGPVGAERELLEHAVLLSFGQAESASDHFHDLAWLCIEPFARRHAKLVDQLAEERFIHRGIDRVDDFQPECPIDGPACLIAIELRRSIVGIDAAADMVLAQLRPRDQAIRAYKPIDHRRDTQR